MLELVLTNTVSVFGISVAGILTGKISGFPEKVGGTSKPIPFNFPDFACRKSKKSSQTI